MADLPSMPTSASPPPSSTRLATALVLGIAVGVLLLDQLTKIWALAALEVGDPPVPILGDLLSLRLLFNPGAALSIGTNLTWLLTIVVVAVVVVIVRMLGRIHSTAWAVALGMLLGGALGNLIDRLARQPGFGRGHVVDFIDYAGFFVGNVADIAIVAAAVLIGVLSVRGVGLDGRRPTQGAGAEEPGCEGPDELVDGARDAADGDAAEETPTTEEGR